MDSLPPTAIYDATVACRASLQSCTLLDPLQTDDWASCRLADFSLWAAGSGALARERASFDARLDPVPDKKETVVNSLLILDGAVQLCLHSALRPPAGAEGLAAAKVNVERIISQLLRLTIAIRRSGLHARLDRADSSFRASEHAALERELTAILVAGRLTREQKHQGSASMSIELSSSGYHRAKLRDNELTLDDIQNRLVQANLRRRGRFQYAQRHSRKIATERSSVTLPVQTTPPDAISPSSGPFPGEQGQESPAIDETRDAPALSTLDPPSSPLKDASTEPTKVEGPLTVSGGSQVSMTVVSRIGSRAKYPRAPKINPGFFKCPCCCQTLSSSHREGPRWKKHLAHDISPYTCVLDDCRLPMRLYNTSKDWETHMRKEHATSKYWLCHACAEPRTFSSSPDFRHHISRDHESTISADQIDDVLSLCLRENPMQLQSCPLCPADAHGDVEAQALLDHVAEHVHSFSLHSLPWPEAHFNRPENPYFALDSHNGSVDGSLSVASNDESNQDDGNVLVASLLDQSDAETSSADARKLLHSLDRADACVKYDDILVLISHFQDLGRWSDAELLQIRLTEARDAQLEDAQEEPSLVIGPFDFYNYNHPRQLSPLSAAARNGDLQWIRQLLEDGVEPDSVHGGVLAKPLQTACLSAREDIVRVLVAYGADVNMVSGDHGTALQAAVVAKSEALVRFMLDHGADPNIEGGYYGTALQAAAYLGSDDLVRLLLARSAHVDHQNGPFGTALMAAVQRGNLAVVKTLLRSGAVPKSDVLEVALEANDESLVVLLLDSGASVDGPPGFGHVVYDAVRHGRLKMLKLLLERGANINATAGYDSPLHLAIRRGDRSLVEILLDHGADTGDVSGLSPLQLAQSRRDDILVDLISRHMAKHGKESSPSPFVKGSSLSLFASKRDQIEQRPEQDTVNPAWLDHTHHDGDSTRKEQSRSVSPPVWSVQVHGQPTYPPADSLALFPGDPGQEAQRQQQTGDPFSAITDDVSQEEASRPTQSFWTPAPAANSLRCDCGEVQFPRDWMLDDGRDFDRQCSKCKVSLLRRDGLVHRQVPSGDETGLPSGAGAMVRHGVTSRRPARAAPRWAPPSTPKRILPRPMGGSVRCICEELEFPRDVPADAGPDHVRECSRCGVALRWSNNSARREPPEPVAPGTFRCDCGRLELPRDWPPDSISNLISCTACGAVLRRSGGIVRRQLPASELGSRSTLARRLS